MTQRVSVSSAGAQGNGQITLHPSISSDGRYIAFGSVASNLVPGGTNGTGDVYVRDVWTNTTELASADNAGAPGDDSSSAPSLSADGRYVAFESLADNLAVGDTNGTVDIFVRDRVSHTTELVSVSTLGVQANSYSEFAALSGDGRFVAFASNADNLVPNDTNQKLDIFVRDRLNGTTERVSVTSNGAQGTGFDCGSCAISHHGRYVAFVSAMPDLVMNDNNAQPDVFVHDRLSGTTERVSVDSSGVESNGSSGVPGAGISSDGRYVAFASDANNLVANDTNAKRDVFVRDRQTNTTERVNLGPGGVQANGVSGGARVSISADGRCVVFESTANNLVSPDVNGAADIFLRDRTLGTTELVSVSSSGSQANSASSTHAVSSDGRFVTFDSTATNLVPGDTNGQSDEFLRDRNATGFTSVCDPGAGGVIACPCSNAPGGPGRGCDNSSSTGGAALAASGSAYLSMDSLVFTTSGEKPTATSIVMQGTLLAANGLIFGQGVRCVGGTLKRLYTKVAAGGSITAPNFGAGDPKVSVRSAALGDVIAAGESRFYLVYYRDPVVLGGCPSTSSFNATQTGRVMWGL